MLPKSLIPQFDDFLGHKNITFEAVAVGGTALALLGIITRETRDCDILSPEIPAEVAQAAAEFADIQDEFELRTDWLNNGPASLIKSLPKDWSTRTQIIFEGKNLKLFTLGRTDLLKTKLFALCDRDIDLGDCLLMKPTENELRDAMPWVKAQDAHPKWPERVDVVFENLKRRLGYGV